MFFEALQQHLDNVALVDVITGPDEQLIYVKTSYSELQRQVETRQQLLKEQFVC